MDIKQLTAICGLDCFNCVLYQANITQQMTDYIVAEAKISPEQVACQGCRSGGCLVACRDCATEACAKEHGVYFCSECPEFPCAKFIPSSQRSDTYPHNFKLYNLCRIKLIGLDEWAKEAKDIRTKYFKGRFVPGLGPIID